MSESLDHEDPRQRPTGLATFFRIALPGDLSFAGLIHVCFDIGGADIGRVPAPVDAGGITALTLTAAMSEPLRMMA